MGVKRDKEKEKWAMDTITVGEQLIRYITMDNGGNVPVVGYPGTRSIRYIDDGGDGVRGGGEGREGVGGDER